MPSSSAAARRFALGLATLVLGAAQAYAQGSNVTAFNPYSGSGLPGGPTPSYGPQAAYPIVDTVGPAGGPAFNPWQPADASPMASSNTTAFNPGTTAFNPANPGVMAGSGPTGVSVYNPGSYLPAPPRRIESRIVAIPERGTARIPRDLLYSGSPAPAPAPVAAAPPPPAPSPAPAVAAMPPPVPVVTRSAAVPAPAPPPAPVAQPTPPPIIAAAAPPPPPQTSGTVVVTSPGPGPASGATGATVASIPFAGQSADLNDIAKAELDRVAKNISEKALRQVELRAYASGADPDSRKIALARALVVRSYLIDRGVKSRIEVGGFAGDGERVDILVPRT